VLGDCFAGVVITALPIDEKPIIKSSLNQAEFELITFINT